MGGEVTIGRDDLGRALARLQGVSERRKGDGSANVLVEAKGGQLVLTATDTELAYVSTLNTTTGPDAPWSLAVPSAELFAVIRLLPDPIVVLGRKGKKLGVASGRSEFKLPALDPESMPALPPVDGLGGEIQIAEGDLRRLIEQVAFSVAQDDVRYGLNGVHMEVETRGGVVHLALVSTDGHRLSYGTAPVTGPLTVPKGSLVPRKALAVLRKMLGAAPGLIKLEIGEGAVRLTRGDETFWFRLIEGQFPDWRGLVPTDPATQVFIASDEIEGSIRRAALVLSDRRTAPARFHFSAVAHGVDDPGGLLSITASGVDRGDLEEAIGIEITGKVLGLEVGLNVRYLGEAVAALDATQVLIELVDPLKPVVIRSAKDPTASLYLVMPMRLD